MESESRSASRPVRIFRACELVEERRPLAVGAPPALARHGNFPVETSAALRKI